MARERGLAERDERGQLLGRARPLGDELEDPQPAVVAGGAQEGEELGLAYAFGSVWVTNREGGTVQRIDPNRNAVVKTMRFPGQKPSGIVAAGGAIWVGDDYGSEVRRLDPRTYRWSKLRTRQLGSSWLAAAGPVVWVSNTLSNSVTRIDARRHAHREGGPEPGQPGGRRRRRLGLDLRRG